MERLFVLLLLLPMTAACGKSGGGSGNEAAQTSPTEALTPDEANAGPDAEAGPIAPPAPVSTVPALAQSFKTNVELIKFDATREDKYNEAVKIVKLVVGTEEFRKKVLAHTWDGTKQFANNNGLTNTKIYQSILDAAEKLRPAKNNSLDLEAELYYENNSVVGYTMPSVTQIWVNRKFFDQYQPNSVAGNLFHEWLHKLGYGHDSSATAKRPYSVPYAIGYLIRDIGKKFL